MGQLPQIGGNSVMFFHMFQQIQVSMGPPAGLRKVHLPFGPFHVHHRGSIAPPRALHGFNRRGPPCLTPGPGVSIAPKRGDSGCPRTIPTVGLGMPQNWTEFMWTSHLSPNGESNILLQWENMTHRFATISVKSRRLVTVRIIELHRSELPVSDPKTLTTLTGRLEDLLAAVIMNFVTTGRKDLDEPRGRKRGARETTPGKSCGPFPLQDGARGKGSY